MDDKRQMTMKDIARELGVSVATVSRALSDSPSISRERRQAIQQFARSSMASRARRRREAII